MGTYTTNYNLFMPSIGEQGWGTLVNGNFVTIDTTMGDFGNRIGTLETETGALKTMGNDHEERISHMESMGSVIPLKAALSTTEQGYGLYRPANTNRSAADSTLSFMRLTNGNTMHKVSIYIWLRYEDVPGGGQTYGTITFGAINYHTGATRTLGTAAWAGEYGTVVYDIAYDEDVYVISSYLQNQIQSYTREALYFAEP